MENPPPPQINGLNRILVTNKLFQTIANRDSSAKFEENL